MQGVLYKRILNPLLQYTTKDEAKKILRRYTKEAVVTTSKTNMAKKVLRYECFWPTVNYDAADYNRWCDKC